MLRALKTEGAQIYVLSCSLQLKLIFSFLWDLCNKMHLNICWTVEKDDGSYQLWQSYDSVKTWQRKYVRTIPPCYLSLQPWNFFNAVLCSCRLLSLAVMLRWVNVILNMTLAILNWWYFAIWTMWRFQPIIRDIGNTTPVTTWITGYTWKRYYKMYRVSQTRTEGSLNLTQVFLPESSFFPNRVTVE